MKIDLSAAELFANDEIEFDKKVTIIFGKNGTGKSTITEAIKSQATDYDVYAFQGFRNVVDENNRLNAVVLGEENAQINKQIIQENIKLEKAKQEKETILLSLSNPGNKQESNFWTRREHAKKKYSDAERSIQSFYTECASNIKKLNNPQVSSPSYNKRDFFNDIKKARLLSADEIKQCKATIESKIKTARPISFPTVDFQRLQKELNSILNKAVTEKTIIGRLDNNPEKREFARRGLAIHKKGDVCSFCGNRIKDETLDELSSYFSADEVKACQVTIQSKTKEIDSILGNLKQIYINDEDFYPEFSKEAKELDLEIKEKEKVISNHLSKYRNALDEKLKFLFEPCNTLPEIDLGNYDDISRRYDELLALNNNNDLSRKQNEAKDALRLHNVKDHLDIFKYDAKMSELSVLKEAYKQRENEFASEEGKITGAGGMDEKIKNIQNTITELQNKTKNEYLLASNINKKLRHMVSFELVHAEDKESKGFYRIKNIKTGNIRDVTELSTGEKNIIAFLYFIEKLNEIKDFPSDKPRVIVFDDPMNSNDDGMQYLIIEELNRVMKKLPKPDYFIVLTHNKHFYLNLKFSYDDVYKDNHILRLQNDGTTTIITTIACEADDFKTSYESLWQELLFLFHAEGASPDLLLNPIRRILETYTKFNGGSVRAFCKNVSGAKKLLDVNSHSIDDIEAELNGKTKTDIVQMLYDCFADNGQEEHFKHYCKTVRIDKSGKVTSKQ